MLFKSQQLLKFKAWFRTLFKPSKLDLVSVYKQVSSSCKNLSSLFPKHGFKGNMVFGCGVQGNGFSTMGA